MNQAETPPLLSVQSLARRFGDNQALVDATFNLHDAELLALLGPNGAGKTTLIRSIAGRLRLDSGRIEVCGLSQFAGGSSQIAERLGVIPQEMALYEALTATENLNLFGTVYGISGQTLADQVSWALQWTGLEDRKSEPIRNFSGGMKRRLNIACGVLHEPKVILLDEPTVGVDPQSRERIWEMLQHLRDAGTGILLTTHQLDEAQQVSDRIVIIDRGRTVVSGTFDELLSTSIGAQRRVELTTEESIQTLPDGFEKTGERTIAIQVSQVAADLSAALATVETAGMQVVDVRIQSPNLQSVFLHYTGRKLRE